MIQFNQDNGNLLERYVDFSQLHKCIISYLSVSSDAYAFERESMDREVLEFIYKLNYELIFENVLCRLAACKNVFATLKRSMSNSFDRRKGLLGIN